MTFIGRCIDCLKVDDHVSGKEEAEESGLRRICDDHSHKPAAKRTVPAFAEAARKPSTSVRVSR